MTTARSAPPLVTAYMPQGGFGHAVVERLAGPHDTVLPVDDRLTSADLPYADRLVMVTGAPEDPLRRTLDTLSFTRGVPSLGLELAPTELRCGPLVVPGRTACYACYTRRRRQHGYRPLPSGLEPLPEGWAHHHVVLGAGLISLALASLEDGSATSAEAPERADEIGGRVWTVDLVSGVTSCSQTVATDRCPTCSGRYAAHRDGMPALAALLPGRAGAVA